MQTPESVCLSSKTETMGAENGTRNELFK